MAKSEDFIQLYLRYRVDNMIAWHTQRSALIRRRNQMFPIGIMLCILLAAGSIALIGLDKGSNGLWVVTTAFFLVLALALTVILMSSGFGHQADVNRSAAKALTRMRDRKPDAAASDLDVERWIQQTEAIISSANSDVEPLWLTDRLS